MMRFLIIALLFGLAYANHPNNLNLTSAKIAKALIDMHLKDEFQAKPQQYYPNRHQRYPYHTRKFRLNNGPYRHQYPQNKYQMVALEKYIKNRHPASFLGLSFVHAQLKSQPGNRKYLILTGREERNVNGTILVNQHDAEINLSENKDGDFFVKDKNQHIVGNVDLHGSNVKHYNVHRGRNGIKEVTGSNSGASMFNIEQDLPQNPNDPTQPRRHMALHAQQNHDTEVYLHISKLPSGPKYQIYSKPVHRRYRRQVANVAEQQPCSEKDCLNEVFA